MSAKESMMIILILLSWSGMIHQSWGIIAYDCEDPNTAFRSNSIKGKDSCAELQFKHRQVKISVSVIERPKIEKVHLRSCLVEVTKYIKNCDLSNHSIPIRQRLSSNIQALGFQDCQSIHASRQFRIFDRIITNISMNGTTMKMLTISGNTDKSLCEGDTYSEKEQTWENVVVEAWIIILTNDYMANVNMDANEVNVLGGNKCPYLDGHCIDSYYGATFWSYLPDVYSNSTMPVLYSGSGILLRSIDNGKFIIIAYEGKLFTFKLITTYIIQYREIHQTGHPRIIVTYTQFVKSRRRLLLQDNTLIAYAQSKLHYVEDDYQKLLDHSYPDVIYRRCAASSKIMADRLLSVTDHTNAAIAVFKKKRGLMGRVLGDVLHTMQCVPKVVQFRRTKKCYSALAVTFHELEMFLDPVTHNMQNDAEEIDCSDLIPPVFHIENAWVGYTPHPIGVPSPNALPVEKHSRRPFQYGKRLSPYQEIVGARRSFMDRTERNHVLTILSKKLLEQDVLSLGSMFSSLYDTEVEHFETILDKVWDYIFEYALISNGFTIICIIGVILKFAYGIVSKHGEIIAISSSNFWTVLAFQLPLKRARSKPAMPNMMKYSWGFVVFPPDPDLHEKAVEGPDPEESLREVTVGQNTVEGNDGVNIT